MRKLVRLRQGYGGLKQFALLSAVNPSDSGCGKGGRAEVPSNRDVKDVQDKSINCEMPMGLGGVLSFELDFRRVVAALREAGSDFDRSEVYPK